MKPPGWILAAALLPLVGSGRLTAAPSAHDFAREYGLTDAALSPDGRTLGFIGRIKDRSTLYFQDLETKKLRQIDPDSMNEDHAGKKEITGFHWVAPDRVLFETDSWERYILSYSAVDRDAKNWIGVAGGSRDQNSRDQQFGNTSNVYLFGYLRRVFQDLSGRVYLTTPTNWEGSTTLFSIDTHTGAMGTTMKETLGFTDWLFDQQDHPRIGIKRNGTDWQTYVRAREGDAWQEQRDLSSQGKGYFPIGFDHSGDELFVGVLGRAGTWGVYRYNLLKEQLGDMVIENPHFDIINPNNNPGSVGLLYYRAEHRLVGIRYMADWLHTIWLDPMFVAVQEAVDRVLPQTNNLLTSWSDDCSKFLVLAMTERSPGTYYLFDAAKHRFSKLGDRAPWIKPEKLAEVFPITFQARDGMKLHGYLTYPPGQARKGLPLVVFPHGGPFVRDTMDYDPVLQFLATRGYAVLQVNYRGSPGFGQAYYLAGWHEVGKKIQDDITDGVKALIAGGVADPKRIAIFGGSYGGYSALWALENTPALYRCGISLAGVTDWVALLGRVTQKVRFGEHISGAEYAHNYWKEKIGDPATDEASLKAISPLYHVDRVQAPVLVVQGTEDRNVPDSQARDLVAALEARHANYEAWFVKGEGHSYFHEKEREELFNRIDAFLAKNMQ